MRRTVFLEDTAEQELRDVLRYLASVSPGSEQALWADFGYLVDLLAEFSELHQEIGRRLRRAVLK